MVVVERDGIKWSVSEPSKNGPWFFWSEFAAKTWEQETLDVIDEFVRPGSTMIDVGAFIAPLAMWAADRHNARVIGIEPDPVALDYACLNVLANNMQDRITIIEGAVAGHTGTTRIAPHEYGWGSTMTRLSDGPDDREVPCWTLPDLIASAGVNPADISLVKIDTEGAESLLLESAIPFVLEHRIPMFVSMHEPWWYKPVERSWFDGFSEVRGIWGWFHSLTCLP